MELKNHLGSTPPQHGELSKGSGIPGRGDIRDIVAGPVGLLVEFRGPVGHHHHAPATGKGHEAGVVRKGAPVGAALLKDPRWLPIAWS